MAFFKLPWSGTREQTQRDKPARRSRGAQAESVEDLRRRARHRLIGAVVLVLAAVIGLPLVFDSQPRPIPVNVSIDIPNRNQVAPLVVPGGAAPAAPSHAGAADQGLDKGEEILPSPPKAAKVPAPAAEPAPRPQTRPESPPEHRSGPSPSEPKPEPRTAPADAARARALLEGKAVPAVAASPAASAADAERFIVQVGAFADADKVREVRARLERAGLKTYAQVVETKDGKRTRVRLGPFTNRAEADKALARAKALGLDGSVLTL